MIDWEVIQNKLTRYKKMQTVLEPPNNSLTRLDHIETNSRRDNFVMVHQKSLEGMIPWDKSCLYRMGMKTLSQMGCSVEDQALDHIIKCQFCLIWDRYSRAIRHRFVSGVNTILAPVNNTGLPDIYLIRSMALGSVNPVTLNVGKFTLTTVIPIEMETRLFKMIENKSMFHLFGRFICGDQATIILQRPNYHFNKCYLEISEIFQTADLKVVLGIWIQLIRWIQYLEHLGMFGHYSLSNFAAVEEPYFDHDFRSDEFEQSDYNAANNFRIGVPTCKYTIFPKDLSQISLLEPAAGCACNETNTPRTEFFIPSNLLALISSAIIGNHSLENGQVYWSDHLYLQSCLLLGDKSIRGYLNAIILLSGSIPYINSALVAQLRTKLPSLPIVYPEKGYDLSLADYQGVKAVNFQRLLKDITTIL